MVVAEVSSQKRPADVQETVVWRRYSDFRKLHRDLLYIHRNLFRKEEEFPPFPKPTVFGRFEEAVIKERRKSAEELLRFASTITALHNSKQLKSFFEGGEEQLPSETNAPIGLPDPLVPFPRDESVQTSCLTGPFTEPSGSKHSGSFDEDALLGLDILPDLPKVMDGTCRASVEVYDTEDIAEHKTQVASLSTGEEECCQDNFVPPWDEHLDDICDGPQPGRSPAPPGDTEGMMETAKVLAVHEMAMFDPCAKPEGTPEPKLQDDWLSVLREVESSVETRGQPMADSRWREDGAPAGQTWAPGQCVTMAGQKVRLAMEKETAGLHREAFGLYKAAVDVLLQGMQGDPSPERRELVELKTAQYLRRAKAIFDEHLKGSAQKGPEEDL
uniref:PX domain-containing protein n=1 Tax=Eptatretus burgeri TaxID=7764 RepID=A0A8C4NDG8_EPTBU